MSLTMGFIVGLTGAMATDIIKRLLNARVQARHLVESEDMAKVLAALAAQYAHDKRVYMRHCHMLLREIATAMPHAPALCSQQVIRSVHDLGKVIAAQDANDELARLGVPVRIDKESVE